MEPPSQRSLNKSSSSSSNHILNFSCIQHHSNPCSLNCSCILSRRSTRKCSCILSRSNPMSSRSSPHKCSCTLSHNRPHKCSSTHSGSNPHKRCRIHHQSNPRNLNLRCICNHRSPHKRSCNLTCKLSRSHRRKPNMVGTVRDSVLCSLSISQKPGAFAGVY